MGRFHVDASRLSFYIKFSSYLLALFVLVYSLFNILSVYLPIVWAEVKYSYSSLFDESYKSRLRKLSGYVRNLTNKNEILSRPLNDLVNPVDRDFAIVIPKISVNKKVIPVDISDKNEVEIALKQGIGWAKGTAEPGEFGNSLIFSHSASNNWNMLRYNAEFTLLNKLETDDIFTIFYRGRQMDFIVFNKEIVPPEDRSYITSVAEGRLVTLQTCYPPGSDANRLLVRGRLIAMEIK